MKPLEALQHTIGLSFIANRFKHGPGRLPGAVVQSAGDETRDALSKLTSDELGTLRIEPYEIGDDAYFADLAIRKLKLSFDAKCKRR